MAGSPQKSTRNLLRLRTLMHVVQLGCERGAPRRFYDMWLEGQCGEAGTLAAKWFELLENVTRAETLIYEIVEAMRLLAGMTEAECDEYVFRGEFEEAGVRVSWVPEKPEPAAAVAADK